MRDCGPGPELDWSLDTGGLLVLAIMENGEGPYQSFHI